MPGKSDGFVGRNIPRDATVHGIMVIGGTVGDDNIVGRLLAQLETAVDQFVAEGDAAETSLQVLSETHGDNSESHMVLLPGWGCAVRIVTSSTPDEVTGASTAAATETTEPAARPAARTDEERTDEERTD